jgi:hypothetical protein
MQYLFHYTKSIILEKILKEQTLLFNTIDKTNDPYKNKKFDFYNKKEKFGYIEDDDDLQTFYFKNYTNMKNRIVKTISFSIGEFDKKITGNNRPGYIYPRMWSQYGDNSRGVCFVFDKDLLIKELQLKLKSDFEIFYDNIEYIDIFDNNHSQNISNLIKNRNKEIFTYNKDPNKRKLLVKDMQENIHQYFFVKDRDWEEEREFRILIINKINNNDTEPKLIKLNMSKILKYIILGENYGYRNEDEEQVDLKRMINIIYSNCKKKNINLFLIKRDLYRSKYILEKIK